MSFGGLVLTNLGRNELIKAEMGEIFNLTHVVLGDGGYNGAYTAIGSLVNKVMEVPITRISRTDKEILLECDFNSLDVPRAFYLKEIGIIANGVLCYYDNAREDAEYIDPNADLLVKQKRLRFILLISSEIQVNVKIDSSLYALATDLEGVVHPKYEEAVELAEIEKEEDIFTIFGKIKKTVKELIAHIDNKSNPHNVTKAQVELGNVPNVATNDQTPTFTQADTRANIASGEKLSVLMGKIKKFFADLKAVAFSGSYNDLSDKPTIPTVGNGTVTIKQAGTSKGTFTMNQSGDTTIELTDNNTTYKAATQSAAGLMSAADKKKLDGVASGANSYSLPLSTASVRGGVKIGYAANGRNYPVQLSNEQMYVNVPWTDTIPPSLPASGGDADTVDGMHGWQLQTLDANGFPHTGTKFVCHCKHNIFGDNRFCFYVDGFETRVNFATYSDISTSTVFANSVRDSGDNTSITLAYSKPGIESADYFAAWNGYELRGMHKNSVVLTIGAVRVTGDTLRGHLNASEDNKWILGGENANWLNVYARNIECSTGTLSIKSKEDNLYLCSRVNIKCVPVNGSNGYIYIIASAFNVASSRHVKENVEELTEEEARKILDVKAVTFDYIEQYGGAKGQRGVIAEDVYKILPSVVSMPDGYDESEDEPSDFPCVDYSKFVPYLIKMVQVQQKEIDALRRRVDALEKNH